MALAELDAEVGFIPETSNDFGFVPNVTDDFGFVLDPDPRAKKRASLLEQRTQAQREGKLADVAVGAATIAEGVGQGMSQANPITALPRLAFEVDRKLGFVPETQENPIDANRPLVTPENLRDLTALSLPEPGTTSEGVKQFAAEFVSGLTSPNMLAAIATGGAKGVGLVTDNVRKLLGPAFAGDVISHAPEAYQDYLQALKGGDQAEIAKSALNLTATVVIPAAITRHAVKANRPPPDELPPLREAELSQRATDTALESTLPMSVKSARASGAKVEPIPPGYTTDLGGPIEPPKPNVEPIKPQAEVPRPAAIETPEAPVAAEAQTPRLEERAPEVARQEAVVRDVGDPLMRPGPGAQTAGTDLPPGSQLEQLTAAISARTPSAGESVPLRVRAFEAIADTISGAKESVGNALLKTKAVASAIKDSYLHLPEWTDFKRAVGEWSFSNQSSDLATRRFVNQIKKTIPRRDRREAITNWIQADGDAALLASRAAASRGATRRGYEMAQTLTNEEITIARNMSSYLESRLQEGMEAGILRSGLENYITQVWRRPNAVATQLFGDLTLGRLTPDFKFARKRIFDSYFDGEQAGFKPLTKDAGGLIAIYDQAFNRTLASRAFIKSLHENKASDGLPITMLEGEGRPVPKGEEIPEAYLVKPHKRPKGAVTEDGRPYVRIEHSALRDWKYLTTVEGGQPIMMKADMLVHPDHAAHLRNVLGTSRLRENPYSNVLLRGQMVAKSTKLSLSLFHQVQEGIHGIFHRISPFNPPELDFKNPIQAELVRAGVIVSDYHAYSAFSEGLGSTKGLVERVPGLGKLQIAYSEYLFQDYIPRLKMSMATHAFERNLARYAREMESGNITREQVAALTATQANAAFGALNYNLLGKHGRNPTIQDFFRIAALAPDFLEARARFVGQALRPYGGEQRAALGLMGATLYVGARILNQILDDDPHWDKPFSVFYNKKEYGVRTLLGDVQHLADDPRSFFYNRFSPFLKTATTMATGRNDKGIKRSSYEQFADMMRWLVPIPLDVGGGKHATVVGQFLQSAGGRQTRVTARYEIGKLAREFSKDTSSESSFDRAGIQVDSDYGKLQRALEADNMKVATAEYRKLLSGEGGLKPKTRQQIAERFEKTNAPFTGSQETEAKFKRSLTSKQRAVYREAMQERQATRRKFRQMPKR